MRADRRTSGRRRDRGPVAATTRDRTWLTRGVASGSGTGATARDRSRGVVERHENPGHDVGEPHGAGQEPEGQDHEADEGRAGPPGLGQATAHAAEQTVAARATREGGAQTREEGLVVVCHASIMPGGGPAPYPARP